MMWRGAIVSSILHGGLLIGLVGSLPILPRIFDRTIEPASTELQISVDVVSAGALKQLADIAGLRNLAPDAETALPPPGPTVALSAPDPVTSAVSPDPGRAPDDTKPTPLPSVPSLTPPSVVQERQSPNRQNQERQSTERQDTDRSTTPAQQQTASISVTAIPEPAPAQTPPSEPGARATSEQPEATTTAPKGNTSPGSPAKTSPATQKPGTQKPGTQKPGTLESEFLNAVSGRKRNLIVKVLEGDARTRRALTEKSDAADIPEQARTRTLDRLNKAAQAGFPHAQYNLAGKYLRGEHVPRDLATAKKWLTRAAEQGFAPAQSLLALMRFTGQDGEQNAEPDVAEAAFWWSLAAEAGNPGAKLATEQLRPLLKPQEHVRSKRLRARWGHLITDLADRAAGETSRRDLDRALQTAAEKGDLESVLSLLARGADADQSGDAGRNAVINAAWRGRLRIIQLLLERGVATELPDNDGRTPLIWAAINGHDTIVTDLVAGGANPNKRDRDGGTALIRAAWNGHTFVVSQLIGAGADVNVRDDNGLTALDHARRERNTAVIRLLEDADGR